MPQSSLPEDGPDRDVVTSGGAGDHVGAGDWAPVAQQLRGQLTALAHGEVVAVDAPGRERPAKLPGLGRRILGTQYANVAPWVRLERVEDHLVARCVNDHRDIGFPLSMAEKSALLALGWREPGALDGPALLRWVPDDVPRGPYLPRRDLEAAVALTVASLRDVFDADAASVRVRAGSAGEFH